MRAQKFAVRQYCCQLTHKNFLCQRIICCFKGPPVFFKCRSTINRPFLPNCQSLRQRRFKKLIYGYIIAWIKSVIYVGKNDIPVIHTTCLCIIKLVLQWIKKKPFFSPVFVQTKKLNHFKSSCSSAKFLLTRKKLMFYVMMLCALVYAWVNIASFGDIPSFCFAISHSK